MKLSELRASGWRTFVRRHGWRPVMAIVLFYLIRDTFLYIILPFVLLR